MDAIADFEKRRTAEVARIKEEHARAQLDGSDVIDESLVLASGSKRRCFEQAKDDLKNEAYDAFLEGGSGSSSDDSYQEGGEETQDEDDEFGVENQDSLEELEAVEEEEQDEVSGEHTRRSLRRAAARTGRESIRKLVDQINHMQDENPQADKTILATMEDDDDDDDDDYVAEAKDDECRAAVGVVALMEMRAMERQWQGSEAEAF